MRELGEALVKSLLEDDNIPFAEINLKKHKGSLTYLEVRLKAIDEEGIAWIMKVLDYANQRSKENTRSGERLQGQARGSIKPKRDDESKVNESGRLKYRGSP